MSPGDQSVIGPGTVAAAGLRGVELARESRTRGGRVEDERGGGGRRQGRRPAVNKRVGDRRRRNDYAVGERRNVGGGVLSLDRICIHAGRRTWWNGERRHRAGGGQAGDSIVEQGHGGPY